jgi:N-acetylneuraminate synthase
MSKIVLDDGAVIENFGKPYIIAEVNSSHSGCLETAKQMVDEAKNAGCSCVKFQSWSAESLYSKTYYSQNPIAKRIVDKFSLSSEELLEVAQYCKKVGVSFSSTPYSKEEADFLLDECEAAFIKVASMDINNYDYLAYIAKKNRPIVLSTGMAEFEEIKKAVSTLEENGNTKIAIFHCVSIYPAEPETINLNNMIMLREAFPNYPIGFSDHTLGTEVPIASVALGAALIEKHFTLDSSKMGMDNNMAMEPKEMKKMVDGCNNVQRSLGHKERIVSDAEYKQRENMRRSVIVTKALNAGDTLSKENLSVKRPGTGLPPEQLEMLIGKTVKKALEADTILLPEDVE